MRRLLERERWILRLRYGLENEGYFYSSDDVAKIIKTTPQRVRDAEKKALDKLGLMPKK